MQASQVNVKSNAKRTARAGMRELTVREMKKHGFIFPMGFGFVSSKRGWGNGNAVPELCALAKAPHKGTEKSVSYFDFAQGRKILHGLSEVFERMGGILRAEKPGGRFRLYSLKRHLPDELTAGGAGLMI